MQASWLKSHYTPQNFPAVIAGHPNRSNLARPLIDKQVRSSSHVHSAISDINRLFCQRRKCRKKLRPDWDNLVRLLTNACHPPADLDVTAIPVHSPEGITRQRFRRSPRPRHDHPAVHTTCKRSGNPLLCIQISRQDSDERLLELLVIFLFTEKRLILEALLAEVALLFDAAIGREYPR